MKTRLLPAIAVLMAFAGPAAAQTAEEAVAYAFLGLADGAKIARSGTTMDWVETGSSPAAFEGAVVIGGQKDTIHFTVKALADCRYEVTLEGPGHLVPGGNRLFARVDLQEIEQVTLDDDGMHTKIEGIGFCETGQRNPTCMAVPVSDFFGVVDPERHKEALAFLRDEVCTAK
ncbi:MAG: hypothetical protein KDJ88_11375 [Bauldia sp.]|nr:hypothetical protein [Bauldia sp.]